MDLWVKTQNKEQLIKIEKDVTVKKAEEYKKMLNVSNININDEEYDDIANIDFFRTIFEMEGYLLTTDAFLLGIYNSKERALEVLDEIQSLIETNFDCCYSEKLDAYRECHDVYEMPKE